MLRHLPAALACALTTVLPATASTAEPSSSSPAAAGAPPVRLHAAGSLRAALTQVLQRFERDTGVRVIVSYGASGLLRDRLEGGEASDVFASANMEHPQSLTAAGLAGPVRRFARNQLCALTTPRLAIAPQQVLATMLDTAVKLGSSTPRADPSGDYAFKVFDRAERVQAGAGAALRAKVRTLTGGPDSPPPPPDRNVYGLLVERGDADLFLTYCTNAVLARREAPALHSVALPAELAVGADYGVVAMKAASADGRRLADYLLGAPAREILAQAGFGVDP